MSRKKNVKAPMTEAQISAHEASIPSIAEKAFSEAFSIAYSKGESVLVVREGLLVKVSKTETITIRPVESYGALKTGTRLKVKKRAFQEVFPSSKQVQA